MFWDFNASDFFTAYISVILFVVLWIGFHFFFYGFSKDSFKWENILIPLDDCDIDSGVRDINDAEFDVPEPKMFGKDSGYLLLNLNLYNLILNGHRAFQRL